MVRGAGRRVAGRNSGLKVLLAFGCQAFGGCRAGALWAKEWPDAA